MSCLANHVLVFLCKYMVHIYMAKMNKMRTFFYCNIFSTLCFFWFQDKANAYMEIRYSAQQIKVTKLQCKNIRDKMKNNYYEIYENVCKFA